MADTLTIRHVQARLFGDIDAALPSVLYDAFSNASALRRQLDLDDRLYEHIADRIGRDVEGESKAFLRFVHPPGHRGHTDPLGGSTQGNVTEIVSFALAELDGLEPTRIVGYAQGNGAQDFPQPDYIVQRAGVSGALEVKSTQALEYLSLSKVAAPDFKSWRRLAPCQRVAPRRQEALRQLGYVDSQPRDQQHQLREFGGRMVPFPSAFGLVHVHLVRDARLELLRNHHRLHASTHCKAAKRSCWECLDSPQPNPPGSSFAHVTLVELRNAPRVLVMHPSERGEWLTEYRRWGEAIWAADPVAASGQQSRLVNLVEEWLETLSDHAELQRQLRGWWDRYLGNVAHASGMRDVSVTERFPATSMVASFDSTNLPEAREPQVEVLREEPSPGLILRRDEPQWTIRFGAETGTVIVARPNVLTVRRLPMAWWRRQPMQANAANDLLKGMLETLFRLTTGEFGPVTAVLRSGVEEVILTEGNKQVSLGWRYAPRAASPTDIVFNGPFPFSLGTSWTIALSLGDPRCALGVHPDGRGYLRVPRSLLDPELVRIHP